MATASSPAPRPPPSAIAPWLAADRLHLILMPTERCNFRCVYCYETFEHGRMKPPTIRGLRRLLAARAPTLRSLAIEWFGGEPLLALPVIEEIQRHAQRLAADHPALRLGGSMTTNGSLLGRRVLGRLVGLGLLAAAAEGAEGEGEIARGLKALRALLLQTAMDHARELVRDQPLRHRVGHDCIPPATCRISR